MAMRAKLWTVNGLATELGRDRRTVAKALGGIMPEGKIAGHPAWRLATAIKALGGRSATAGEPEVECPAWMKPVAHLSPVEIGMMMAHYWTFYHLQALVAWAVTDAGGDMKTAYASANLAPMLLHIEFHRAWSEAPAQPWAGADAWELGGTLYDERFFVPVDWRRLRDAVGEPEWVPPAEAAVAWREVD